MSSELLSDHNVGFYEELCLRSSPGYRLYGMLDSESTVECLDDERTVSISTPLGDIPALVPIEHADGAGYDVDRSIRITGQEDPDQVWYFALPPDVANDSELTRLAEDLRQRTAGGFVYFDHQETDDRPMAELKTILDRAGMIYEEVLLEDEKVRNGNLQASIVLYGIDIPKREAGQVVPGVTIEDIYETYKRGVYDGRYDGTIENGTVLMRGSDISADLAEQLWDLYQDRFEWLGENHPISMEDAKGYFLNMLRSPNTLSSVYFKQGDPICFGYFLTDIDEVGWINPNFLHDEQRINADPSQTVAFWPGIVARRDAVGHYSQPVIGLVASVAADTGGSFRVLFENTNLSERYIPRILQGAVNLATADRGYGIAPAQVLDRQVYRCVRFLMNRVAE